MKCNYCGNEITSKTKHCPHCRAQVLDYEENKNGETEEQFSESTNNSISKNDQNSLFLAIVAIIFAFISPIVSIILANIGISESKKQSDTQKDGVLSNKLNKAALIIAIASIIFSVLKTILSIAFDINIYGDLFVWKDLK